MFLVLPLLLIIVLVGIMSCFFGYKIYKLLLIAQGFLVGAIIGLLLGGVLGQGEGAVPVVCAFCMGTVGGFLSWYLFYVGVFLQAFSIGAGVAVLLMFACMEYVEKNMVVVAALITGTIFGIIACVLINVVQIFLTALCGALILAALTVPFFIESGNVSISGVIAVILFAAGFSFQTYMCKKSSMERNVGYREAPRQPERYMEARTEERMPVRKESTSGPGIFAPEIEAEIPYVFESDRACMIKVLPEFFNDGQWKCSCGRLCREEQCKLCGMTREEAEKKLTYQYLKQHRQNRMRSEAEQKG